MWFAWCGWLSNNLAWVAIGPRMGCAVWASATRSFAVGRAGRIRRGGRVMEQLGRGGDRPTKGLGGGGVGAQIVRGGACGADSREHAIDRLQNGDVLVVPCTPPAYNAVLTLAGAIVTADGGPLSHAAVLARELGISAVVGARGALTEIPDGALIDVDPVAGEVRIVSEA